MFSNKRCQIAPTGISRARGWPVGGPGRGRWDVVADDSLFRNDSPSSERGRFASNNGWAPLCTHASPTTSIARRLHVYWPIHHTARRLPTLTHPCCLPVIKVLPVRTRRVRENDNPDRAAQARQLRHQLLLFLTVLKMLLCHIHHTPRPGDPSALLSHMLIRCLSVHLQSDAIRCCDQPPAAIQARLR